MTDKPAALQAKTKSKAQTHKSGPEVPGAVHVSREHWKRHCSSSGVTGEQVSVGKALQERAVADPAEQAQCKGRRNEQTLLAGRFESHRAGEGPVTLHDAFCFLVARADLSIRAASH